eukprot:10232878-Ditylum_brightwellii.AAC.1
MSTRRYPRGPEEQDGQLNFRSSGRAANSFLVLSAVLSSLKMVLSTNKEFVCLESLSVVSFQDSKSESFQKDTVADKCLVCIKLKRKSAASSIFFSSMCQ